MFSKPPTLAGGGLVLEGLVARPHPKEESERELLLFDDEEEWSPENHLQDSHSEGFRNQYAKL